jgi:hypothetical protein
MIACHVILPGVVFWKLTNDSPNEIPVPNRPGWTFTTAGGLARLKQRVEVVENWPLENGDGLALARSLVLRSTDALGRDEACEVVEPIATSVLARLRHVSRQHAIPKQPMGFNLRSDLGEYEAVPINLVTPDFGAGSGLRIRRNVLETAIRDEHLTRLAAEEPDDHVHVEGHARCPWRGRAA